MGRGRAKAKQTKVARELKYRSFGTDFTSLERELRSEGDGHQVPAAYADLTEEKESGPASAEDGPGYEDLRKSG